VKWYVILQIKHKVTIDSYKEGVYHAICRAEDELGLIVMDNAMFDLHWKSLTDYTHCQMTQGCPKWETQKVL